MSSAKQPRSFLRKEFGRQTWVIICSIIIALHFLPWIAPSTLHVMIMIYIYALMGQGWNILGGYAGQFSFGHSLFFGLGAYVSTLLFIHLGLSPWLGMLVSCMTGIVFGLFIGFLCFRYGLKGPFFALTMLAFAEIFQMIALGWKAVGGAMGLLIPLKGNSLALMQFVDKKPFYFITFWMVIGGLYLVWRLEGTRIGVCFLAVKENHEAAEALGVDTFQTQMIAMTISGGMTAMGGTLYAQYLLYIDPYSTFGINNSVEIMLRPVIGGPGTVLGPLLGSVLLTPLAEYTRVALQAYSGVHLMLYGVILVAVIMMLPDGLVGAARGFFHRVRRETT